MIRKLCMIIVICICILDNTAARAEKEYRVVHVPTDISFETALTMCQSAYSEMSGISLNEVKNMEYNWKASPRYLIISAEDQYWKRSDATWFFDLNVSDEAGEKWYIFNIPMIYTNEEPFSLLVDLSSNDDPFSQIRTELEEEYQEKYRGMDGEAEALEKEYGPYYLWSYQDKASFYQKWQLPPFYHDNYVSGRYSTHEKCLLPEENDIQYDIASASAAKVAKESFNLSDELFSLLYEDARFCTIGEMEPQWLIRYWMYAECGGICFWDTLCIVAISRDGSIVGCSCE